MGNPNRRDVLRWGAAAGLTLGGSTLLAACGGGSEPGGGEGEELKLGALIPLTGIETHVGQSMRVSTEIAVDEINQSGGILGRKLRLIVEDEAGNPATGVDKARKLMQQDKVDLIIGTLTSAVRNAVVAVTAKGGALLLNPTYYEGGLCQPNFVSTGALPNQQIEPFMPWIYQNLGKSMYLIGSDYVWPRGSNTHIKRAWAELGGTIVGEEYVPFGVTDFSASIKRILDAKPDVLYPLIAGVDGVTFWKQLDGYDFKGKRASHSVSEAIVPGLDPGVAKGIISAAPYFMVLDNPQNKKFLATYHGRLSDSDYVDTFGEALYDAVHLLAAGAERAQSVEVEKLRKGLQGASFDAPQGPLTIDPATQHAALAFHIAEVQGNTWRDFKIIESKPAIQPAADCGKL
jgi:urea transport system substrate-binding protein